MCMFKGYRVTSDFGWRPNPFTGKGKEWHTGVDLVKSHKAPIEAFADGKVKYAGEGKTGTGLGGYGNVVLIEDKNGRGHLYAHLDSVAVKTGASIKKGKVIGYQGTTGQSTGSHLHFEVRKKTSPSHGWEADRVNNCLDPAKYLEDLNKKEEKVDASNYKGNSIVEYLNLIDVDSSVANRKKLAQEYGIKNYDLSADKNIELLNAMRNGKKPSAPAKKPVEKSLPSDVYGTLTVKVAKLNVRQQANFNSQVVDVIEKGKKFNVYGVKNGLYKIGENKYCSAGKEYVDFKKNSAYKIETKMLKVLATQLYTYKTANWNDKGVIVKKNQVYTIKRELTVDGAKMYQLKSGVYITANPKYVKLV